MNLKNPGFVLLILCLYACHQEKKFGEAEKITVKQETQNMLNNYLDAMKREGLLSEFKFLDNSKDFYWVPPGFTIPLSYDSVRTIIEQNAKAIRSVQYEYDSLLIVPLSPTIANYSAILSGNVTDTSGVNSPVRLIESGVLIKRKDGWKLLSGQTALLPLK